MIVVVACVGVIDALLKNRHFGSEVDNRRAHVRLSQRHVCPRV